MGHAELLFKHSQIECQSLNHQHTARTVLGLVHQSDWRPTLWGTNARTSSRSLMQLAKSYPNKHTRTYDSHLGTFQNLHLKGSWISDANRTLVFFLLTFRLTVILKTKNQNPFGSPSSEARSLILGWPFTPVQICFPQSCYVVEKWLLHELLPIIWPWAQTYIVIFQLDIRMVTPIPQTKYVQSQTPSSFPKPVLPLNSPASMNGATIGSETSTVSRPFLCWMRLLLSSVLTLHYKGL